MDAHVCGFPYSSTYVSERAVEQTGVAKARIFHSEAYGRAGSVLGRSPRRDAGFRAVGCSTLLVLDDPDRARHGVRALWGQTIAGAEGTEPSPSETVLARAIRDSYRGDLHFDVPRRACRHSARNNGCPIGC